ncbi:hypothetical protein T4E_7508 [Trichinella pseudospiralis]|uniref:Uncharacterized protein n=1 Tax=Trichinella pseudospiralis TaxID=6337 RepID=A0A0V0XSC1_TRIPS|nr:hypothetical protein T4E_7508 [Trichinella pseudospiralis]
MTNSHNNGRGNVFAKVHLAGLICRWLLERCGLCEKHFPRPDGRVQFEKQAIPIHSKESVRIFQIPKR